MKNKMKRVIWIALAVLILTATAALADTPQYAGRPFVEADSEPLFLIDLGDQDVVYLPLDALGRVQGVSALIGLGEEEVPSRAVVQSVIPTGWTQATYGFIPGLNLYNRCHLLAHQLGGAEIAENLLTGTQYLNISGMVPFENTIADYVRRTGNHVRMEILPLFEDDNLVCAGVFINAKSVEDDEISICTYCFNVQPGVAIDYRTGYSVISEVAAELERPVEAALPSATPEPDHYVLNISRKRFHYPDCQSVQDMKEKNKQDFYGDRQELIDMGYKPCGNCKP